MGAMFNVFWKVVIFSLSKVLWVKRCNKLNLKLFKKCQHTKKKSPKMEIRLLVPNFQKYANSLSKKHKKIIQENTKRCRTLLPQFSKKTQAPCHNFEFSSNQLGSYKAQEMHVHMWGQTWSNLLCLKFSWCLWAFWLMFSMLILLSFQNNFNTITIKYFNEIFTIRSNETLSGPYLSLIFHFLFLHFHLFFISFHFHSL